MEVRGLSASWITHPRRMLRHKALVQCARVAFGLSDIFDPDEVSRVAVERLAKSAALPNTVGAAARRAPMGVEGLRSTLGV